MSEPAAAQPRAQGTQLDQFQAAARAFSELLDQFERLPDPEVRERVFALLQAVDAIHRLGLTRLANYMRAVGQGQLLDDAGQDEIIRTLLVLYDILRDDSDVASGEAGGPGDLFIPLIPSSPARSDPEDGAT